jgi:predicted  nucleic acid-binding Zn-ribbon protein
VTIKTWLSELNKVTSVFENLKNVSYTYSGATELLNTASITAYSKALDGLNLKQAQLVLTMKGMNAEQQSQILADMGLLASKEKISATLVQEALLKANLNGLTQTEILKKLNLINTETNEIITRNTCTEAQLRQRLAEQGIIGAQQEEILSTIGLTTANTGLDISLNVLIASLKQLWVALISNPLGQIAIAIGAVVAATKIYDTVINHTYETAQKQVEASEELIKRYDDEISSLEELQTKLKDAKGNKEELASIQGELNNAIGDTPGLLNGESTAYDTANLALKRRIDYLKKVRSEEEKNKIAATKKEFNSATVEKWGPDVSNHEMRLAAKRLQMSINSYRPRAEKIVQKEKGSEILTEDEFEERVQEEIDKFVETRASYGMAVSIDEFNSYFESEFNLAKEAFDNTLSNYEGAGGRSFLEQIIHKLVFGGATLNDIQDILDDIISEGNDLNVAEKDYLSSLQNDNVDSEEKLKKVSEQIDELKKKYPELTDVLNDYYDTVIKGDSEVDETTSQTNDNSAALKELNSQLDKIQSAYQTVSSAIEEYNENGYLSVDTFQSLMELEPEYLGLLMDENGNLQITTESLQQLTKARIENLAAKQAMDLVDSVTALGTEQQQLDYLKVSTDGLTASTWALVYAKIAEAKAAGTISDKVADDLIARVNAYKTWADSTIDGINKGGLSKSSSSSKSEKDKAKALKDYEDKVKDINEKLADLDKEEHLANLKYSIETITQDLNKFEQSLDRLSSKLDLTFEKDYSAKLSIIGQQFLGASRYGGEMRVELERLLAIEPQTADEAEELASRLESLSDSFFENEKNIIEYRNSIFETATDYLGESASATVEQVNNAKAILDNTFNVIKNGSLSGDGFWSATLLPSISKDKVTKQRAENNKLIKEEKRYQNAIAKIRKKATDMSYAEEKEEREKQRQEYQEELQEAYEDYQDKADSVIGKNIEVTDSVKSIGDEYLNTAVKAEDAAQRISDAVDNINWEQRSYANKSYTYEDGAPTSAQYQYAYGDSKSTVVVTKKAKGGTTTNGLTITGDGTGAYAGQEAYIGQDSKLHLFNNEAQLSELPPNTRIVNAKDLQNIIKYTGMKYFYQPIENIQSATVDKFAQGNTNVSFSPIPYNTLSTQALYSDVDVQAMVEETIAEINNEFNALKGNIKFSAVQNAFKNSLTDKKMYKDLSNTIVNMTSQSLDKADKSTLSDSVVGLILQNSAWDDLPNELQNKLSELNVNADNWTDWIKDSNNSLQAFNLMQDGGMSSWDLLDSNVTSLLQQAGINGKDAWDKFVQDDPLQALTLLSSSWNSMNDTIGQYMTDAKTIAANGARAIQSLQIIAPSISEQSWNALQVLIANKIQEIISLMNEVFGENTVD